MEKNKWEPAAAAKSTQDSLHAPVPSHTNQGIPYLTGWSYEGTITTMNRRNEVLFVLLVHQGMKKASPSITILKKGTFQFLAIEHFLQWFKIDKLQAKFVILSQ